MLVCHKTQLTLHIYLSIYLSIYLVLFFILNILVFVIVSWCNHSPRSISDRQHLIHLNILSINVEPMDFIYLMGYTCSSYTKRVFYTGDTSIVNPYRPAYP